MPDTTPDAVETATPDPAKPAVPAKRPKANGSGEITAADVAKIFDLDESEVLSFKDYGHSLTVVTTEGAKLTKPLA